MPLYQSVSEYGQIPSADPACKPAAAVFATRSEAQDAGMAGSIPKFVDFDEQMVAQDGACDADCTLLVIQPAPSKTLDPVAVQTQSASTPQDEWIEVQVVLPDPCCSGPYPGEEFLQSCHAVQFGVLAILPASDRPVCFTYRSDVCIVM